MKLMAAGDQVLVGSLVTGLMRQSMIRYMRWLQK